MCEVRSWVRVSTCSREGSEMALLSTLGDQYWSLVGLRMFYHIRITEMWKRRGSRLVASIQTHRGSKASFCPLWTKMLFPFLGGFAEPVRFYLASTCLFSLSRGGANALNCFIRDCETWGTSLEGALRCSGLVGHGGVRARRSAFVLLFLRLHASSSLFLSQ